MLLYFGKIEASVLNFLKAIANLPPQNCYFTNERGAEYTAHCGKFWDKVISCTLEKNLFFKMLAFRTGEKGAQSFSLEIPRGKKVGIVGISGSGKIDTL